MPGPVATVSPYEEMASELRRHIENELGTLASILTEGYAAGFIISFGLSFDPETGRFTPNPVKISREF